MNDNKENGPEDAVVSEMIKILLWEKFTLLRSVSRTALWVRWMLQARGKL